MLLGSGPGSLAVECPVRVFHGMRDRIVPASQSRRLMDSLKTDDVHVTLIKVHPSGILGADKCRLLGLVMVRGEEGGGPRNREWHACHRACPED